MDLQTGFVNSAEAPLTTHDDGVTLKSRFWKIGILPFVFLLKEDQLGIFKNQIIFLFNNSGDDTQLTPRQHRKAPCRHSSYRPHCGLPQRCSFPLPPMRGGLDYY